MRTALLVALMAVIFTSCSRYQYVTIGSDIKKNDDQAFVADNDSIRVQYNFNGQDAPINLTIENKLDIPIYVNWQQSALIVNDKAISYSTNAMPIEASLNSATISWVNNYSTTSGNISGHAILPDGIQFIPPHSYITKSPMGITNQLIANVPDSIFRREKIPMAGNSPVAVKHATFTGNTSPLQFKSYLTVMFGEKPSCAASFEHSFYISEIYKTGLDPESFWYSDKFRGDQYYVKRTTGAGKGFGIVGGIALLTAVEALDQTIDERSGRHFRKKH